MPNPSLGLDLSWIDGRLVEGSSEALAASTFEALDRGTACYTTVLIRGGTPRWAERHARRLRRDAQALGFTDVEEAQALRAMRELAHARFSDGDGIVRVLASGSPAPSASRPFMLVAEARELESESEQWKAIVAPFPHTSHVPWTGAKGSNHALYHRARRLMTDAKVEEALLVDDESYVIEGSRSNIFVVDREGALVAPNISRGAVAGLAQEIVHEYVDEVVIRDLAASELATAREIIAVNSVRHARPVIRVGESPIGTGKPGPWYERLHSVLSAER